MKHIILIFLGLLLFSSCEDQFIDKKPTSEVAPAILFKTEKGFRTALDGVYAIMKQDLLGYNFAIYTIPEAITDDFIAGASDGWTFEGTNNDIYTLNYNWETFQLEGFWEISYTAINNANTIIKYGAKSSLTNKNQYLAEALAQRAILHYNLYRFFAPAYSLNPDALAIPYRFENDALLDKKSRNTNKEVIDFIIRDLTKAITMANNQVNSYKISKTAMQVFLARVYHEIGDYDNAITYANNALTDKRYTLNTSTAELEEEWTQDNSSEIIYRIRFEKKDEGANAAMFAIPLYFSFPYYISDELINLYDKTKDIRFNIYFEESPVDAGKYYPKKHIGKRTADYANYQTGAVDIKLARVPELYLILAESYQQIGDSGKALNSLNQLRSARGLSDYSGSGLLDEIYKERRRELMGEGFRFTDLKRLKLGFQRPDGSGLQANDNKFALPIPKAEIDRSGIKQNEGYAN